MDKKEERIRNVASAYYSRKDVLSYIFKFSKDREVVPRYFEGFGRRPDYFQYPYDIISLVKKGATSFHCSEELWVDPLKISTGMNQEELNSLRRGWDVLIDIDCPWIDYSKKAALSIIQALEYSGVKNFGVKFSGSKGFHIIIPWESFPDEIDGIKTSDMFPEWPRAIVSYLKEISRPILQDMIKDIETDFKNEKGFTGIKCENCKNLADENFLITLRCEKCHPPYIETFKSSNLDYKKKKCPTCFNIMDEASTKKFYMCYRCSLDSLKNPDNFNKELISIDIFKILGLDILLVSPRHLFRMPFSLHEKTALSSVVLEKNEIANFDIRHADPLNVKIKEFYPTPKKGEARNLLIQAVDFQKMQDFRENEKKLSYKFGKMDENQKIKIENIPVEKIKEEYYPPIIKKILLGMSDGKKRALFILINFFRSLGYSLEDVEKKINEWNKKNKPPLKKGYIDSQLLWHSKNKPILPPNFDNEIYKGIGVFELDDLSLKVKNPVTYVTRKAMSKASFSSRKNKSKNKKDK